MSTEEPAWKAELMGLLDEHFISSSEEIFDLVLPHIQAAEERGRRESSRRWESALKADWTRYRGNVLDEVWKAMRDAEGGPLLDAMRVINDLLEKK